MALTTAFCANGNKSIIPQTTTDGTVSYDQGFGSLYALPPEEGGKFIDRAQFNQLMYDISSQTLENKTAIATKANANATVNLSGNQTINGTKTFNNDIVSPNITAMQNNLNTIFSSTTSPVKAQTSTKIITVGAGGDFATIPQAIAEAIKYTSKVEIKLISNLNTTGDIDIANINGANITINFNTYSLINTNTTTANRFGFFGCKIGDVQNLSLQGYFLFCSQNTQIFISNSINIQNRSYSAPCIQSWRGSTIVIYYQIPISISSGNNESSIVARAGGIIAIENSTITDTSDTGTCLQVYLGGFIFASNSTINTSAAKANQAANTPTANGIIFGNYSL